MGNAIEKLKAAKVKEIREWRDAYRPFRCVPENCENFERQAEEMVERIDFLLELIAEREKHATV